MLYTALSVSAVQPRESAIHIHIFPLFFLDFLPIWITTELQVEFPVLYNKFSLFIYFIHSSVYVNICMYVYMSDKGNANAYSVYMSFPPPSPPWYSYICSLCLCLYFCFANKIIYTIFSRLHIYALIYYIFLFLTYFTLYNTL